MTTAPTQWKPAPDLPGVFVSEDGRVRSDRRQVASSTGYVDSRGYLAIHDGRRAARVHRLIALAFLPERESHQNVVRHLNGDKLDNRAANLAWGTQADNVQDMLRLGEIKRGSESPLWKTECTNGHELTDANVYITPGRGSRQCRTCRRLRQRKDYRKTSDGSVSMGGAA